MRGEHRDGRTAQSVSRNRYRQNRSESPIIHRTQRRRMRRLRARTRCWRLNRSLVTTIKALAQLIMDHYIGVTTARTYTVKKIDVDYFTEVPV